MPITRAQEAAEKRNLRQTKPESSNVTAKTASKGKPASSKKPASTKKPASRKAVKKEDDRSPVHVGEKREADADVKEETAETPPTKKAKTEESNESEETAAKKHPMENEYHAGLL